MARTMGRDVAARLRAESESTRDDAHPADTRVTRPNRRTTVYSVRPSTEEQARVEAAARPDTCRRPLLCARGSSTGWTPGRALDDVPVQ